MPRAQRPLVPFIDFEHEDIRTGAVAAHAGPRHAIFDNLHFVQGRVPDLATTNDWYMALAYAVRDRILLRWIRSASPEPQRPQQPPGLLPARRSSWSGRTWATTC